jgi:hypothetical protein
MSQIDLTVPINISVNSLAGLPAGDSKSGYTYAFPKIIVKGKNNAIKQKFLSDITGLNDTNFLISIDLLITFHNSISNKDFVRLGGLGNNTYKLKNLNKRLSDESLEGYLDKPILIDVFSKNIAREYTLLILHDHHYDNNNDDIVIDTDRKINFNNLLDQHNKGRRLIPIKEQNDVEHPLETYDFYKDNILRFAQKQNKDVFLNIINGKSNEEILYECADFVFVRDILWKTNDLQDMRCIIIFKNKKLMSIRDLQKSDIEMIERAENVGIQLLTKLFDVSKIKMETYFHYHPSIWLLHMHFVSSTVLEDHKKFFVKTVIDNLNKNTDCFRNDINL